MLATNWQPLIDAIITLLGIISMVLIYVFIMWLLSD